MQQPLQRVLVERCNPLRGLLPLFRRVLLLRRLAERAQPLDVLEEGLPTLLFRDVPEHAAHQVYLAAQGLGDAGALRLQVKVVPAGHDGSGNVNRL